MPEARGERLARGAYLAEKYVLSAVYLAFSARELVAAVSFLAHGAAGLAVQRLILVPLQALIGVLLARTLPPKAEPREAREVLVPLASVFYFVVYDALPRLPPAWRDCLCPGLPHAPVAAAALALGMAGPLLALWGVANLGGSFGIFVSARDVVVSGPYRYVRHPIYLGYVLSWAGLVLAHLSPAVFVLVPLHVALFIWRARLEEARLAAASPEYRAYQARTGFLFPRF